MPDMPEKASLRSERMPFIPRLESLGFSGIAYKIIKRLHDEATFGERSSIEIAHDFSWSDTGQMRLLIQ